MPTYQYRCTECGEDLEVVQKFSDAALTECPNCHGPLRKVFNAVGVVFKGSGFYRTDSRKGGSGESATDGKPSVSAAAKDNGSKESGSTGTGSKESGSKESGSKESAPKASDSSSSSSEKKSSSSSTNGSSKPSVGAGSSN